jgi:hypothetical protein
MKTRLISLLLAFSMALTFLPVGAVSAFAAETGSNKLDLTPNTEVTITETATYDLLPSENAQGYLVIDAPNCTVTLRMMGNINIAQNQNNFIVVNQGTLVLEGSDYLLGYSNAISTTHPLITVSSGAKAVINDGQFNSNSSIVSNSGTVEINGSGRYTTSTSYVIVTRPNSVLTINDGYFHSDSRSVIYGESSQEIEINDGTFINESPRSPTINLNHDKQVYIHGGTIQNLVGGRALDTGDNTTIEEQNGKKILLEGMQGTYVTIAVVSGATFNFKSGTVKSQNSAAIRSAANATVNITGGTISNSLYGVKVQSNPKSVFIGRDVHFENNTNDICMEEDQLITIADDYEDEATVLVMDSDLQLPRPITTTGNADSQKKLKLHSNNADTVAVFHDNGDETGYQELVKRTGYFVNVVSGTASIDGGTTALSPTTQVPDGTPVSLSAAPAQDGMEFEQWVVSPASALTDPDFDLTASKTSFHMPDQDITLTAQYRPIPPTIDDAPVDPAISTAVTIIGGALLVGGLHQLGTELWLIHHLPKGTAIPETRIELAEVLWKDAGQPAPAAEAAYTDIDTDDTDAQQAAQWAIENELMTLRSSEHPDKFDPHVPVSTVKAIRAWKKAQQMKPSTK